MYTCIYIDATHWTHHSRVRECARHGPWLLRPGTTPERGFFIDNQLIWIHVIIEMIWWTGLASLEFEPSSSSFSLSSLELSNAKVHEPWIRAIPGIASHFCEVVVTEGIMPQWTTKAFDLPYASRGNAAGFFFLTNVVSSHRMQLLICFRKSTPPQNCQLNIYYHWLDLLSLIKLTSNIYYHGLSWRFCGGVDIPKPMDKSIVWDKVQRIGVSERVRSTTALTRHHSS